MLFPKQIQNLIEAFERLPGIGSKTAERLSFYLLHVPDTELKKFSDAVSGLKQGVVLCSVCKNISNLDVCEICDNSQRDHSTICVVENPLDVYSLEKTGKYDGLYHVLHGVINPLENIGPEELYIQDLINRIQAKAGSGQVETSKKQVREVILALNPTMEGEATAMYLRNKIEELKMTNIKITRLGVGMPMGGDMQYADETTLARALEGRRNFN